MKTKVARRLRRFSRQFLPPNQFGFRWLFQLGRRFRKRTNWPVRIEEDTVGRGLRFNQSELAEGNAILEQPLSFPEYHWIDPYAVFVDKVGGDQRLQQIAATPDMQFWSG